MKKILVIEDNQDIRENIVELLELSGYDVLEAENGKVGAKLALTFIAAAASGQIFAQTADAAPAAAQGGLSDPLLWIIYLVVGLLLIVTYLLYLVTLSLKKYVKGEFQSEEQRIYDERSSWEKIFQLKPVETDKDTIIDEAHDGIYELDNPPPPWFMFLFYGTVLFAVIYFVRYSVTKSGLNQEQEYLAEVEVGSSVDESNVEYLKAESDIAAGKTIYIQNCKVCHEEGGKGMTGPNLTDEYWKHGGGIKNIFKTIKYGVVEKGMRAWGEDLKPKQMQQVASYILSLEGTNHPGAKAPEGDKWVEGAEPAQAAAADSTVAESK